MASDNKLLGNFELVGIPPAPRGVPQVEVSFDIDANGILHVSAKDLGTGKEQSIRITASSGLSEEEVNNMTKEAESHATEDIKKKELAMARNEADTLAYSVEKSLSDYGDKLTPEEKTDIEATLETVKRVKESSNEASEIKEAVVKLTNASHKIAEHVYKAAQEQQAAGAAPGGGQGEAPSGDGGAQADEDVVEAEFEDVDKKDE